MTFEQFRELMPRCPEAKAKLCFPPLAQAMAEAEINTPLRQAAFLAQLAHESGELRYFEELTDGKAYEGRKDLGNTQPGDGPRYKGRGPIQLTGRANYRAAGNALRVPLEVHPDLAATVDVGFRVAAWFWNSRCLSPLADAEQFDDITRKINGGQNGREDRIRHYLKAKQVLGVTPDPRSN